jgi:hypothetical protein
MCWKLCWVHGQSAQQGIVHEPADVTLCATMCSDRVYVVNEQKRVDLFGTNLDEMIQQVIMASKASIKRIVSMPSLATMDQMRELSCIHTRVVNCSRRHLKC